MNTSVGIEIIRGAVASTVPIAGQGDDITIFGCVDEYLSFDNLTRFEGDTFDGRAIFLYSSNAVPGE